jgi:hypothetical protein
MIVAVIVLAWLLLNTLATLIIICVDGGTPSSRVSDWVGIGISCVFSPLTMMYVVQPIYSLLTNIKRRRRKK